MNAFREPGDGSMVVLQIRQNWVVTYCRNDRAADADGAPLKAHWRTADGRLTNVQWFSFAELLDIDPNVSVAILPPAEQW